MKRLYLSKNLMEVKEQAMRLSEGNIGKGNIICKEPEAVASLTCSKKSIEVHVAEMELVRKSRNSDHMKVL